MTNHTKESTRSNDDWGLLELANILELRVTYASARLVKNAHFELIRLQARVSDLERLLEAAQHSAWERSERD